MTGHLRQRPAGFRTTALGIAAALLLSACADPLTRSDALWPYSGDAVAANKVAHIIDPWPAGSRDVAFPTVAERVAEPTVRYKTGRAPEAVAAPVLVTR